MRRLLLTALVLLAATSPSARAEDKPGKKTVTYLSPTECRGNHGAWRWDAKTIEHKPPDNIPATHRVTPTDIGNWRPLEGKFDKDTPRRGREHEWYELTGRVVLIRVEHDGDLHIVLEDADGKGNVHVVIEVPVKHHKDSPWSHIRKTVFGWTDTKFPFVLDEETKDLQLKVKPVIRVVGKAFYDAEHDSKTPNRRQNGKLTVWEIHPVMKLKVLEKAD